MCNRERKVLCKKKKIAVGILCSLFTLGLLTGCGKSTSEENGKEVNGNSKNEENVVEDGFLSAEEFNSSYINSKETDVSLSQEGNYIINGVELCDAVEPTENADDTWEGYTVEELGLLPPEKMPNCIVDEAGHHGVVYEYVYYVYANDMNEKYGERSSMSEYANVWCSVGTDTVQVLGGWEEYGRLCAERGEIFE